MTWEPKNKLDDEDVDVSDDDDRDKDDEKGNCYFYKHEDNFIKVFCSNIESEISDNGRYPIEGETASAT